ncbi:hypothetical protein LEP1GSC021_3208 [Leptospira noguchii str. 1993005606]|nr:hypothetical protein LEP1GSC021_3208 [Leptospira noguchii str. 1993005606]
MLKNSIVAINKIVLIDRFHRTETDGEFIFKQPYCIFDLNEYSNFSKYSFV